MSFKFNSLNGLKWATHGSLAMLLLLTVAGFYLFSYAPAEAEMKAIVIESHEISRELRVWRTLASEKKQMTQDQQHLGEQIASVRDRIPQAVADDAFLVRASNIASTVGVQIVDYRRGGINEYESHSRTSLNLTCVGSYESMCRFVDELENLPRYVSVKRWNIGAPQSGDPFSFEIEIELLFALTAGNAAESA
ncbi:MAG: type 4a pilus biogenesis protein PilO [bacterium]|nr:type 4a pilus biogenesis protein PilO [bacterium]